MKIAQIVDHVFGETIKTKHDKIFLPMLFTIILCTTTLFFFDHREIDLLGFTVHFSVGLLVFPLTFTISNILQDNYGKLYANTVTRYAFICDLILVSLAYALCRFGDREDYFTVYKQPLIIMGLTFFTVWMSNLINTFLFDKIKNKKWNAFFLFSVAAIISEPSISAISIPIMMVENNLTGGALVSIFIVVTYKISFTIICSLFISMRKFLNNRRPLEGHSQL